MINQTRLVNEFCRLVSFDSESFGERQIADYLIHRLKELGLTVEEDLAWKNFSAFSSNSRTGNLYACLPEYLPNGTSAEPLLFSAHMDTVKPGIGKTALLHEDGRITSDGTTVLGADDAAGIAEILEMLAVLQEQKLPHPALEIVFAVAEEPYCIGSAQLDYSRIQSRQAYVLDLSGPIGRAASAAPTIFSVTIEIKGRASHAGFHPEAGIHAIEAAAKAMAQIPNGRNAKGTTVNFGTIQGGAGQNIVPEFCRITGEIRSLNHEDAEEQAEHLRRVFEAEAAALHAEVTVQIEERIHAYRTEESSPVVQRFRTACTELNLSGELEDTLGGSDLNQFSKHGIQGLVLANAMNEVHTTKEFTSVEDLVKATELIVRIACEDI